MISDTTYLLKYLFLIIYLVACYSCHRQNVASEVTMTVEKEDLSKRYKLSDIVQDYDLIPLETNDTCLIGNCRKIIFDSTTFYLKDGVTKTLFHFNLKGKLLRKIGKTGRGPSEYLYLDDFCILKSKDIIILDGGSKKIIIYDSIGRLVATQNLPFFAESLEVVNDSVLVFKGTAFEKQIMLWNYRQKQVISSFLEYDPRYRRSPSKSFSIYNNEVLWRQQFQSRLFKVTENELIPCRYIDFKNHSYDGKLDKSKGGLYFAPSNTALMDYYCENNDYIFFRFQCDELSDLPFFVFYFKDSQKKVILNNNYYIDDMTFYHISPPQIVAYTVDNRPVCVLLTSPWLDKLEEESKENISLTFRKLHGALTNVSYSDNPVLVIYKLKKNIV